MADAKTRRPLISGNWKMNLNHFEALQTVQKLGYLVSKDDTADVDVTVHPPFTDLRTVQTSIDSDKLPFILGAQHCHWEDTGAYTGEVSPAFLAKLEVRYVICGHSERRELFGETDEMVAAKATAIMRHGMTPIICVGETQDEREAGATESKVLGQLTAALAGRSNDAIGSLVIAYEPIWAIGTGLTATSEDAQAVCAAIRGKVAELHHGGDRRVAAHPVRRFGQGVEHRRADGAAGHRRRARRRGQPRPRRVRAHRQVRLISRRCDLECPCRAYAAAGGEFRHRQRRGGMVALVQEHRGGLLGGRATTMRARQRRSRNTRSGADRIRNWYVRNARSIGEDDRPIEHCTIVDRRPHGFPGGVWCVHLPPI